MILVLSLLVTTTGLVSPSASPSKIFNDDLWFSVFEITNLDFIIAGFSDCYISLFIPELYGYGLNTPITTPVSLFGSNGKYPSHHEGVCHQFCLAHFNVLNMKFFLGYF